MLKDDNARGALPTLTLPNEASVLRDQYGTAGGGFVCTIVSEVRWDRVNEIVQVHFDARGDLFLPSVDGQLRICQMTTRDANGWIARHSQPVGNHAIESVSGHWKGCVEFPVQLFNGDAKGMFYIDQFRNGCVKLFTGRLEEQQFDKYTVRGTSPYDDDAPEIERARFEPHVPPEFMNRGGSKVKFARE